ncbi:MAG: DUF885 domain-containing protein [Gammaproteobacteria bacterium]|nr:DUF885 domain-containing protein [Gammaproteobacteria bacterium]
MRLGFTRFLLLLVFCLPGGLRADAADRLHDLFDREWAFRVAEDPLLATSVGRHEYNDRLPVIGSVAQQRRGDTWRGFLAELGRIDRAELSVRDKVNYDIFAQQLEVLVAEIEFRTYEIPLNADSGFHMSFARLPVNVPLQTTADFENYLSRLRAFPKYTDQQIANMRAGIDRNFVLPAVVLKGYEATIAVHVVSDPLDSVFYRPFHDFPESVPETDREALAVRALVIVETEVVPAYSRFFEFMVDEYIPQARTDIAATSLPNGNAYYAQQIRQYTTLEMTAEEIHALGLEEVARIRAEMLEVMDEVGFDGGFQAFLGYLRTEERFYPKTAEELMRYAAYLAKKMDAQLPKLFRTLPRLPYGVEPVPASIAPKYTTGRYVAAPFGSTRAGTYWVNTYALDNRPLYNMEALTLHEAVPGHHVQIALASEIEDLPAFRRFSYLSAFGEGWGLYAEWLGLEVGFYTDPYSNFGRLSYEMWRACRLVVDTGMHAFGWTRQQAVDYMAANTALALHNIRTEVDRYISWPAQALAYKLGEMKIKSLRRKAEQALGSRFDVRDFHDAVLLQGAVPLPVLERQVEKWISEVLR